MSYLITVIAIWFTYGFICFWVLLLVPMNDVSVPQI